MRLGVVFLMLTGCWGGGPDPDLVSRRQALDAWERGVAAIEAGDGGAAEQAFVEAQRHRPGDPLLRAWQARAQAEDGQIERAIETLDHVLEAAPTFAEARYNRAAWLARAGRVEEAGPELARALEDGGIDPREVLEDVDFQPHLGHPALAFLPDAPLDVQVEAPDGPVFLGSEAPVRVQVRGRQLEGLQVVWPAVQGPARVSKAVERWDTEDGDTIVEVTWYVSARGAGQITLGPARVAAGDRVVEGEVVTLVTLAPPEHEPPADSLLDLRLPSAVSSTAPEPLPAPIAWREGPVVHVRVGPGERVEVAGTDTIPSRWQRFDERDLTFTVWTWNPAPPTTTAKLSRGGKVLRDGVVE